MEKFFLTRNDKNSVMVTISQLHKGRGVKKLGQSRKNKRNSPAFWFFVGFCAVRGPRCWDVHEVSSSSQLSSCWSTNLYGPTVKEALKRCVKAIFWARYTPHLAFRLTSVEPPASIIVVALALPGPLVAAWVHAQGRSQES